MRSDERGRFEQLTLPHLDAAYNLARWLIRDEHSAEDVVQEAWLRAARYFASFRGGDARVWLLGIVRRAAWDLLARRRTDAATAFDCESHDRPDDRNCPEFQAIRRAEQAAVRRAIEELPPVLREAIVLRELQGLSYQQIAAVADVPIGTVMSRLSRGRQQLERRLAPCVEEGRK